VERLPVYPEHLLYRPEYFEPAVRGAALRLVDETGYVRPRTQGPHVEAA
jgi:hypothetical protein